VASTRPLHKRDRLAHAQPASQAADHTAV
jgi:hypothetical protein